jgi:hypothetical protein
MVFIQSIHNKPAPARIVAISALNELAAQREEGQGGGGKARLAGRFGFLLLPLKLPAESQHLKS